MARPSKDERNKDIIKKYDSGWGYERIGNYFNLHPSTVKEIILRWYPVYGKKDRIRA